MNKDVFEVIVRDKVEKLPRLAKVAFAARCALRALPLFEKWADESGYEHKHRVADAIEAASLSASDSTADSAVVAASGASSSAVAASGAATEAASEAAIAAAAAADAAAYAASEAVDAAIAALRSIGNESYAYILADLDVIIKAAMEGRWTDTTPVKNNVFGAMWPGSKPEGWPAGNDTSNEEHNK